MTPAVSVDAPTAQQKAPAVFRIVIPKKSGSAQTRRPGYVSPATQALSLAISGPTTINQSVALTTSSGNCTSTLASTQCTLTLALSPGNYTATLSTYDGYDAGTQTATGNLLSAGQNIAFTIHAGQANAIAITLAGVPAQIVVAPLTVLSQTDGGGYDLVGAGPHPFVVEALDADGNIIAGPGAPTFTIGAPTGSLGAVAFAPNAASPNLFYLVPPLAYASGTSTFAISASYAGQATDGCAQPGAVCGRNVTVHMVAAVVVANCGTCNGNALGPDNVQIYAEGGSSPLQTLSGTVLAAPENVAFDAAGDLFVASQAHANVVEFLAPSFTKTVTINFPGGLMAVAPNGTLYLADRDNGDVMAAFAPPYTGAAAATWDPSGGTGVSQGLGGFAVAPNGDLWASDNYNRFVWKFAAPVSGSPSPAVTLTGVGSPTALTLDPTGDLFVADTQNYLIDKFAPPVTSASSHATISLSPNVNDALLSDAAGNVYASSWNCCSPPMPTALYLIPAGTTAYSASIAISPNEPFYSGATITQLRSLGLGQNGVFVNDLGNGAGEPNVQEFNFGLTARIGTITNGITQPWALVVEP